MTTVSVARTIERVPEATIEWLTEPNNPAVAALTRSTLLGETDSDEVRELWGKRNQYAPVARILRAQHSNGAWAPERKDYKKYEGSLWQIHFLGELYADGDDPRVRKGADYAFSRQLDNGLWSCNGTGCASIPCLTANVGRALARLGYADDERVISALKAIADMTREQGYVGCPSGVAHTLNGYCHMAVPKILLFLSEVPRESWPDGADWLLNECVSIMREREVLRSLPRESEAFQATIWEAPASKRAEAREQFIAEHPDLHYTDKPEWLRFGYPQSHDSDALEALNALAGVGEPRRPEYEPALCAVEVEADDQMRWRMRDSLNGKMLADVERKLMPSKWLTLRALQALQHYEA
jgi:hypothetical protein